MTLLKDSSTLLDKAYCSSFAHICGKLGKLSAYVSLDKDIFIAFFNWYPDS